MATRPESSDEDPVDDGGMISLEDYEVIAAEQAKVDEAKEAERAQELFPTVTDARLQELKEKARQMIEERLRKRRKERRLMRGGNLQ